MSANTVQQTARKLQHRLPTLAVIGLLLLGIYSLISRFPLRTPRTVTIPEVVPLLPLLALPYLGVLIVGWFLPLALRDNRRYQRCLRSMIWAFIMTAAVWILIPTVMSRPPIPTAWWNAPYRWLLAWDAPTNVLPCGHILAPLISGWYLLHERPHLRWWIGGLNAVSVICIACTWQHRPIDMLIGALLAGVAVLGVSLAERRHSPKALTDIGDDTAQDSSQNVP